MNGEEQLSELICCVRTYQGKFNTGQNFKNFSFVWFPLKSTVTDHDEVLNYRLPLNPFMTVQSVNILARNLKTLAFNLKNLTFERNKENIVFRDGKD